MNLLFPRHRKQRSRNRGIYRAHDRLGAFSFLAVFAIFSTGALGLPQAARAQNDVQASQPVAVPAPAPGGETKTQNLPKAEPPKVDTTAPQAQATEIPKVEAPKDAPAAESKGGKSYIIGPNDVLNVKVWNQPQISAMVDVHLDGMISLQLAGEIKADGLTTLQLKDAITKRLEEVALTAPVVDVSVLKINSKHYYVYGGVLRPGEFTLAERVTIMDALSLTGFKDFAKQKKIELRRDDGGKKEKFLFNYPDYIKGKNMDKNINRELQDGDQIIVPE